MTTLIRLTMGAAFGAFVAFSGGSSAAQEKGATDEKAPAASLAAQLRTQGFRCDKPVTTERDAARSKPGEAA
jgi:hypothetical protein